MPCKGLQVKLDSDPTRCDKPHLKVTLQQVYGAMLDMLPFIIRSLRDARKYEVTQLLLDSCLSQCTAKDTQ